LTRLTDENNRMLQLSQMIEEEIKRLNDITIKKIIKTKKMDQIEASKYLNKLFKDSKYSHLSELDKAVKIQRDLN